MLLKEGQSGFFEDAFLSPILMMFTFLAFDLLTLILTSNPPHNLAKLSDYAKSQRLKNHRHFTRTIQAMSGVALILSSIASYYILRDVLTGKMTSGVVVAFRKDEPSRRSSTTKSYATIAFKKEGREHTVTDNLPACERFVGKTVKLLIRKNETFYTGTIDRLTNKYGSTIFSVIVIMVFISQEIGLRRSQKRYAVKIENP